jgi:hypothetical protein
MESADPLELAIVQHPQELRLEPRLQVPDLVEEDRAPARQLETSHVPRHRAGEGAPLVPEELALDHRGRESGAVHVDEGAPHPGGELVDRPGREPLAGAGFAGQEDRRVEG